MKYLRIDYHETLWTENFIRVWDGSLLTHTGKSIFIAAPQGIYLMQFIGTCSPEDNTSWMHPGLCYPIQVEEGRVFCDIDCGFVFSWVSEEEAVHYLSNEIPFEEMVAKMYETEVPVVEDCLFTTEKLPLSHGGNVSKVVEVPFDEIPSY